MLINFFLTAWRNAIRHRAFTLINVVGLSIGLTCCLVLVIFSKYETSFDQYHADSEHTYRIVEQFKSPEQTLFWNTTAYPLAEALRNDFSEFSGVTQAAGPILFGFSTKNQQGTTDLFEDEVLFVDNDYAKVFELNWLAGNSETALRQPNSVVLTRRVAEKCFGTLTDANTILGRTIEFKGEILSVSGIIGNAPGNTSLQYSLLVPFEFYRRMDPYRTGNWSGNYQGSTFIVLKNDVEPANIQSRMITWQKKYLKPEDDARIVYQLQPLKDMHNDPTYGSSPGSYTMPMDNIHAAYAVAIFILIIASINFVNLATAQAAARAKEVGVRKAMGSSRTSLIRQFMFENLLFVFCTLLFSLGLTNFILDLLNEGLSVIHLSLQFKWSYVLLACGLGGVVIMLAAVYPALVLSGFRPAEILKNKFVLGDSRGGSLRKSLIVLQFVIVQIFIIATIVVSQQMHYVQSADLGFDSEHIIKISVNESNLNGVLKQRLLQQEGVAQVSFGSGPPLRVDGRSYGTSIRLPGQGETEGQEAEMKGIDTSYLAFYNIKLIAGRNIHSLKHPFDEFVINERTAAAMGWTPEEAIGRRLVINEGEATVVGVVRDFHNSSLQEQISPCVMINWSAFQEQCFVKLNAGAGSSTLEAIEDTWQETFPTQLYKYDFLTDSMLREYTLERTVLTGFSIFSFLSIVIGAMGLLGMISFMTSRKTKEVGIRKILGASVKQIVVLFSKEFVWLVGVAFVITVPLVYAGMSRWLSGFAYRIDLSWWMFVAGGGLALLIAVVTVFFQSARAAVANPIDSLRSE
jgi:ABC-type lipoprotein release transport system permease subunit